MEIMKSKRAIYKSSSNKTQRTISLPKELHKELGEYVEIISVNKSTREIILRY